MRQYLLFLFLVCCLSVSAQQQKTWEEVWHQMISEGDLDEEYSEDSYEYLQQLSENPINLNQTSRKELEQLPFLSEQQIDDLLGYLYLYGPMLSLGELRMVRSMDYQQIALLPFFVVAGEAPAKKKTFPSLSTIEKYGKHTITATARIPFYYRKGDYDGVKDGYKGYKYRHSLRYQFSYGSYLKIGLVGSQDAGEPFLSSSNPWGYDSYSYYLQIQQLGLLENMVVGKYKLSTGMGLVLNSSFSLGKQVMLQNMGRQTASLRPHTSRSEADYMQGAAATISLTKPLTATVFASYRPIDVTLNTDGTVSTLITSGYHRTPTELKKKHNTHQTDLGATINYRKNGFHMGANAVYTAFDRPLHPDTQQPYRQYYVQGSDFLNASLSYGYNQYRFSLNGETATNRKGALATIHSLSYLPSENFRLMALQRLYRYDYTSIHAHSFGETSRTQNETGYYLGFSCQATPRLSLQGYADYAYFPWVRYQVSQPSHAWDFMLQADYQLAYWSLMARHRIRLRQKDNADKTTLIADNEHRGRLTLTYAPLSNWSAKTEFDYARSVYKTTSFGYMLGEHLSYACPRWQMNIAASYFHTDDYNSRIYIYERQMQHDFSFPMFYGQGIHMAFFAKADVTKSLMLSVKLGYTNYFDRAVIGSGMQQILQSHTTDLDLQVRCKF